MKILVRSVLLILLLSFLLPLSVVYAIPPTAQTFWGSVTLDGSSASDGTSVTAEMNGRTAGSDSTSGGNYSLIIQTIEGDNAGDTIDFFVDGNDAGSTTLNPGGLTEYDLSATSPSVQYTLTINESGNGSTTGDGTYDEGADVNISADPDNGWEFDNWTGDVGTVGDVNSASTNITMNGNYTITANFSALPNYNLTIDTVGDGSTTGTGTYYQGEDVSISATPGIGWQFDDWSGDVSTVDDVNSADTSITMNGDYSITANFSPAPDVTLTMAVNGNGSTSPTVGDHIYAANTVVNITATPDSGWLFDNWSGDVANRNSASTTVTMDSAKTVTANFSPAAPVTLTMAVNGNGSTSPAVGEHDYPANTVVNITATPDSGWQFDNWTGAVANPNSASTTVTMDSDKTVTANFSPASDVTLTMAVNGNGSTSPAVGIHTYAAGTVVPIAAIAAGGWQFDDWTGAVANPNSAITTVTMDTAKTVTANFSEIPTYTLTMAMSGNGSTSPTVGNHTYAAGTVVPIAAIPAGDWQFDSWSGDVANPNSATTTVTMTSNKTVTANFSLEEDITPPVILAISAPNITKTGVDISWSTNEPSDSQVDYWSNPGELTPLDETLVTEHLVQLRDLIPATTYHYKVMSRDEAGNLAVSGEYTFTTTGLPATFTTGDWDISQSEVDTGTEATISFWVTNTGDLAGSYQVAIAVNGVVEATTEVILDAGASEEVTFTTTKDVVGTYLVSVDQLTFSFAVTEAVAPPPSTNWWLIVGIIIGVVLLIILSILFVRKAKLKAKFTSGILVVGKAEEKAGKEVQRAARQEAERLARERAKMGAEEAKKAMEAEKKARLEAESETEKTLRQQPSNDIHVEIKEGGGVLTVTALAVAKLKEAIQTLTTDPEAGIRFMSSPSEPDQFEMVLDREKEGDQVVEWEGLKILLLHPELAPILEGMIIDCQETPQGIRFTLSKSKLAPDT